VTAGGPPLAGCRAVGRRVAGAARGGRPGAVTAKATALCKGKGKGRGRVKGAGVSTTAGAPAAAARVGRTAAGGGPSPGSDRHWVR